MRASMEGRGRVKLVFPEGEGRTKQAGSQDVDINKIMDKHRSTGFVTHVQLGTPVYGDFSTELSYQESRNHLINAETLFLSLPARVRNKCENDPAKLITLMETATPEELVELGLKNPVSEKPVIPPDQRSDPPKEEGDLPTN